MASVTSSSSIGLRRVTTNFELANPEDWLRKRDEVFSGGKSNSITKATPDASLNHEGLSNQQPATAASTEAPDMPQTPESLFAFDRAAALTINTRLCAAGAAPPEAPTTAQITISSTSSSRKTNEPIRAESILDHIEPVRFACTQN